MAYVSKSSKSGYSKEPTAAAVVMEKSITDICRLLDSCDRANTYRAYLMRLIPQVEFVRQLYHTWITLSPEMCQQTKDTLATAVLNEVMDLSTPLTPLSIFRSMKASLPTYLAYYLAQSFEKWTQIQETQGAPGFNLQLVNLTNRDAGELYKTVSLLDSTIIEVVNRNRRRHVIISRNPFFRSINFDDDLDGGAAGDSGTRIKHMKALDALSRNKFGVNDTLVHLLSTFVQGNFLSNIRDSTSQISTTSSSSSSDSESPTTNSSVGDESPQTDDDELKQLANIKINST